ncbi:aquaporin PIP2-7-like [Senna tora]|uniref:Aquaporin PIP2-7-like n=1 Tax=Senna tora TaxID=362788 RepID=A0A834SXS7_9FABA|nr:aquaporin PIP2-7-like [Senna tora]
MPRQALQNITLNLDKIGSFHTLFQKDVGFGTWGDDAYKALITELIATDIDQNKQPGLCDYVGPLGIAWAFDDMIFIPLYTPSQLRLLRSWFIWTQSLSLGLVLGASSIGSSSSLPSIHPSILPTIHHNNYLGYEKQMSRMNGEEGERVETTPKRCVLKRVWTWGDNAEITDTQENTNVNPPAIMSPSDTPLPPINVDPLAIISMLDTPPALLIDIAELKIW